MAKSGLAFVCRDCGGEAPRWSGQCPHCRAWNTLEEIQARPAGSRRERSGGPRPAPVALDAVAADSPRLVLRWGELNRVLGGGLVPGGVVLVAGEPGVGKSTLLMHVAAQAAAAGAGVLYAAGEESAQQVALRARRLGAAIPGIRVFPETDLDAVLEVIGRERPALVIVDSVQTLRDGGLEGQAGSVTQVREAAGRLLRLAKETGVPVILVGHVTKEGAIAGPRVLEHMVDAVLYLEGERGHDFRVLRAQKNRFGSTQEIGIFTMGEAGLEEVQDPSALLAGERRPVPGTAVMGALEGSRPLLVEVQALVTGGSQGLPRRSATGLDLNRLHMIVAVLDKRSSVKVLGSDVLANVAGGFRVQEPAADLALALAISGSHRNLALPQGTVVIGELGLAGEVRRVAGLERRLQEAERRGFTRAVVPPGARPAPGLEVREVRDLVEALAAGGLGL